MRFIAVLKPKRIKRMNRAMTRRFERAVSKLQGAPVENLEREAREFKNLVFERRSMAE